MSCAFGCCSQCGKVAKMIYCWQCKSAAYCSQECREEDDHDHLCLLPKYRQYADMIITDAMMRDIGMLFNVPAFAQLIRAMHVVWDPFHVGHMSCEMGRISLKDTYGRPVIGEAFISCTARFVSGITNSDYSVRHIRIRYIYKPDGTGLHCDKTTTWAFDTRLADDAYNKLCGSDVLNASPERGLIISILPATGTCAVIVDGKVHCLK